MKRNGNILKEKGKREERGEAGRGSDGQFSQPYLAKDCVSY